MRKLLVMSFDAVGDETYGALLRRPNFARLASRAAVCRGVDSVYLSNTYPVHASVATGRLPRDHGLINNVDPFPQRRPRWHYEARRIRAKTLWQAAAEKDLSVAAVMWPVTGGAREIRYNIPELMAQPGENQILLNMRYGSKALQLGLYLKYKGLLQGIHQPARDRFATACMADLLRKKAPALALMHLTAYDTLCHEHGLDSPELERALDAMDENLGVLLAAAGGRYEVIVFSDHAQLPAQNPLLPNRLLAERGYITVDENGDYQSGNCFFECCGGSAFLHPGALGAAQVEELRAVVQNMPGFGRLLRGDEMDVCGRAALPFGFAAAPGWACEAYPGGEKANHGYPLDYEHYKVFYLCDGEGFAPGLEQGGSLLEVTRHAADILGLDMGL